MYSTCSCLSAAKKTAVNRLSKPKPANVTVAALPELAHFPQGLAESRVATLAAVKTVRAIPKLAKSRTVLLAATTLLLPTKLH
jgi:hypothetical protein